MKRSFVSTMVLAALAILVTGCTSPGNIAPDFSTAPTLLAGDPIIPDTAEGIYSEAGIGETEGEPKTSSQQNQKDRIIILPECEVTPGRDASFIATFQGSPVSGANVSVNYVAVGTTDDEGRIYITLPYTYEIKIEAVQGDLAGELELDLDRARPG